MADADQTAEAYEANVRLALVCVDHPDRQGPVMQALQEMGYRSQVADSPLEAIERMRKTAYEVLLIDEEFQGATPHDNPVLKAIQGMPMSTRRYIFVALLGKGFKTFDNMMAFAQSVNVVVNLNDVPQIKPVLQRGVTENDQFYRVFRQVMQEAGRR